MVLGSGAEEEVTGLEVPAQALEKLNYRDSLSFKNLEYLR